MKQSEALEILKLGHNAFVTGAAGSGKTFLINEYIKFLKREHIGHGITASTGIAATHLGGITIHSWSGLGIKEDLSRYDLESLLERPQLKKNFASAQVLIIDEISMLHDYQLEILNRIAQAFRRSDQPFGGLQVIFCGDFFQLPPVSSGGRQSRFAYHSPLWAEMDLKICYLDEQHRQNDQEFLRLLGAIRGNQVSAEMRGLLEARLEKKQKESAALTKLYSHNADVDEENERELARLAGPLFAYGMAKRGRKHLAEALTRGCLAPEHLRLKAGARVMFVKNNFEQGYVNGTLGRVEKCDETGIIVKTAKGRIEVPLATWVIEENGEIAAEITQYPLRLAWAITVHKSQGMSLDSAEIDLSRAFEPGMGYVALSRVRSLSGLSLLGINDLALRVNEEVLAADQVFRMMSDDCRRELLGLFPDEKRKRLDDFLRRVGNTAVKKDKAIPKTDSLLATHNLIAGGLSVFDVAEARGMTIGTIIGHLEKLKQKKCALDLNEAVSRSVQSDRICQIIGALNKSDEGRGEFRLAPAAVLLGGNVSYDEIRLVRLLTSHAP